MLGPPVATRVARPYLFGMTKSGLLLVVAVCAVILPLTAAAAAKKSAPKPAAAAVPGGSAMDPGPAKALGNAGAWTAYLAQNKTGRVCYVVGQPEAADAAAKRPVMAMVTHRTEDKVDNVVSFDTGMPLSEDDDVTLEVGPNKYTLFAKNDTAWARTSELDRTIVGALAKEKRAMVKATAKKGRVTTDTYSLAGFSKALDLIDKACDVKR